MRYAVIPAGYVDQETKVAAHRALAFARKELRLPYVQIKWFVHDYQAKNIEGAEFFDTDGNAPVCGLYEPWNPQQIMIMAMQREDEIQTAVLHEAFHVNQCVKHVCIDDKEAFSYSYASDALQRMKGTPVCELDSIYLDHMGGKDWSKTAETAKEPYCPEKCGSRKVVKRYSALVEVLKD